jgi:hypothetical protein
MTEIITIPAHIEGGSLRLDAPIPPDIDRVEVRAYRSSRRDNSSLADVLAQIAALPPGTRTKEDIDRQIADERSSWR